MILTGYRADGIELYKPMYDRKKQLGLLTFAGLCVATPGTNWLMAVVPKFISKHKPLWIFK